MQIKKLICGLVWGLVFGTNLHCSHVEPEKNSIDEEVSPEPEVLLHPENSSAYATRILLETGEDQPLREELLSCKEKLSYISQQITSDETLVESRNFYLTRMASHRKLYHWCFYYVVSSLDQSLFQATDLNYKEKSDLF